MSELSEAIQNGDSARVEALIDADPSLLKVKEKGVTPVLLALYHGQGDLARLLARRGPPLTFPEACALGEEDRARALLASDRERIDARSEDGFPPLGLAIFFGQGALARWLIDEGADVNAAAANAQRVAPLHAAAAVRDRETMRALLERGADPNGRQQMDYTPLHGAASRGDVEMAEMLLARGAVRDAMGTDGLTPAGIARKYGQDAFAEWIESAP